LNNEKLLDQCKVREDPLFSTFVSTRLGYWTKYFAFQVAQCRCEETLENIRSLIGSDPPSWTASTPVAGRRHSLPTHQHSTANGSSCSCWEPVESPPLDNIPEEYYNCRTPNPLQRSCTWQYSAENFDYDDKLSSSADNTTEGSETGTKRFVVLQYIFIYARIYNSIGSIVVLFTIPRVA
jgi:hypothetical protein